MVVGREHLKVGVVGLGYFAQLHLDAWQAIDEVELLAVTDQDPEKVTAVARARCVTGVSDLAELLSSVGPLDILDLVVPPSAHESLILQALDKVPLIICQKPFCANLTIARELAKTAQQSNSTLLVHENFRFQPWFRTLKHWLDSGAMGEVFQARFALRPGDGRGADAYLARQPSFQTMKRLLLHETGVHYLDVLPWLFGEVQSIYAQINKFNPVIAGEDAGIFILEHASGARSVFDGNRLADHVAENTRLTMGEMIVEGEAGTVTLDGSGTLRFRRFGEEQSTQLPSLTGAVDTGVFGGGCVEALNRHVVQAILGDLPFENEAMQYLNVLELCEAAYSSAESGCKLSLQ